jgi:hypothetical protein
MRVMVELKGDSMRAILSHWIKGGWTWLCALACDDAVLYHYGDSLCNPQSSGSCRHSSDITT